MRAKQKLIPRKNFVIQINSGDARHRQKACSHRCIPSMNIISLKFVQNLIAELGLNEVESPYFGMKDFTPEYALA